ncbi:MAG TPA: hypothetical protein VNC22_14510 [Sporichthya sp.]|nr:hypothetical protein [Sporichthya sp.]
MRTYMRACAGAAVAFAIVAGPIVLASTAEAAPYARHPHTKISTGHVRPGGDVTVSGSGWQKDTQVEVSLAPGVVLGTVQVNPDGTFASNFTMPAGLACHYDVTTRGLTSGVVTTNQITIGDCSGHQDKAENKGKDKAESKGGKGAEKSAVHTVTAPVTNFVSHNPKAAGGLASASVIPLGAVALLRARRR